MIHILTQLQEYYFEKYLFEVAIATLERGGVTSNVDTYEFLDAIDAWGFPKYPEKTVIVPSDMYIVEVLRRFISQNSSALRESGSWLGTWIDPLNHCCYLDITALAPCLEVAKAEVFRHRQQGCRKIVALYNLKYQETVYLDDSLDSFSIQR